VVSLSNHEQPFDKLRANGEKPIFTVMTKAVTKTLKLTAVVFSLYTIRDGFIQLGISSNIGVNVGQRADRRGFERARG
jgi:hypothetical protein